jgi:broad specificity phosphatase PhoE
VVPGRGRSLRAGNTVAMPIVLLVRHGQASFGGDDYDRLSDLGREQSQATGRWLRDRGLRRPVVVHGSLRRQRDTAALSLAAADLDVAPRTDPRWDEYDHLDLVRRYAAAHRAEEPRTSREFQVLLDSALVAWVEHGDEGGWSAFANGVGNALRELVAGLQQGQDAVVFTSAGVIAAVCADLLGAGAAAVVALNRVAVNGAVTKLAAGQAGVSLLTFNEHGHLDATGITYR